MYATSMQQVCISWKKVCKKCARRTLCILVHTLEKVCTSLPPDDDNYLKATSRKHFWIFPQLSSIRVIDVMIFFLKNDARLFSEQRRWASVSDHQYWLSLRWLNMSMALSAENAPPPQRIIAYQCMNPRCAQSLTSCFWEISKN